LFCAIASAVAKAPATRTEHSVAVRRENHDVRLISTLSRCLDPR
jgi:hypothetical protein